MPTTSTSQLITGRVIKTKNSSSVNTSSLATLESYIAKSLLSESSTANGAAEFDTLIGTTNNIGSNHRAEDFANDHIHVITSDDLTNRNYIAVANYVSNEDTTTAGEVTKPVKINATTSATVTSKVLDDSSAYKNTSIKVTLSDPYFTDPEFSDSNDNYLCTFDTTTTNNNVNRLIYTRNVNANSAHTDYSSTITASEDIAWNTQDGYGSYFINGTVSIDSTTGQPSASLYAEDSSFNFLSKNFTVDLNLSNPNVVPIFGRYQAIFSTSGENTVTVTPSGNSSLVLTTDLASWDSFINDLDTTVPLTGLPPTISDGELQKWVKADGNVLSGFTLQITSTAFTSSATFNNTSSYSAPVNIDLTNMNFTTKAMYILEKSMETNAAAGSSILTNPTIHGTTYQNKLTVTNGSLSLETTSDVTSGYYTLLDGYEALESDDLIGGQDGTIQSYNSARVAAAGDSESIFPRASRSAVSSSDGILDNLAVQYKASESGYQSSVGVLTGNNLTASSVTYAVTTLVGQTTTDDGTNNWSDLIGVNSGALAIVKDSNSSITPTDISFFSNTNTYSNNNDNKLSVIDIVCNKVWSESKVYATDNTVISGLTADIKSFNMDSVPLDLKDIRFILDAKSLSDLTLEPSGNWVLSCPDSVLTSSSGKLGLIEDATITEKLLTEADSATDSLFVSIAPRITSVVASKFSKFHYNLETSYQDIIPQITYDDEFTILNYSKSSVTTSSEITGYLNVPANTKLYKRSYTESFKVKVPFRYGYYDNLFLTSETLSYDIEYYVLTDNNNNNADLPRYYLNGIKTPANDDIYATVTETNYTTFINFSNKDFKPYNVSLQKKDADGVWENVSPSSPVYADLWYNSLTTITSSIGSFSLGLTLSPDLTSLSNTTFYIDLELDKGTSSFTISGKNFTDLDLNSMSSTNLNTFSLAGTSYGTAISYDSNAVTYARDSDVNPNTQASTTLTAGGYVFKLLGEMYLSIRIFVCPNGIFKLVKTSDETPDTTYHTIETINGTGSLDLDTGVYGYGNLLGAIRNTSSATWSLNKDAIQATYYGTTGFIYQRITSLNQEFRPVSGARGFKTTIVRGFTPSLSTTITRTLSTVQLDLAGDTFNRSLLTDINGESTFGGITMSSNSAYSMYPTAFATQTWTINLTYGSYTLSDKVDTDSNPEQTIIYAYKSIISDRRELKIISTSLNTNNFSYIVQYTSSNVLTIRRNPDIVAPNYIDSSGGYVFVTEFTPEQLKNDASSNLIGNILNVHYTQPGTIPDMDCYFSITPPYLKFTAIDPSNVSAIPFNSSLQTPVTRYLSVNNVNTTTSGSYYPFTSHPSINNIRFDQNNVKQYLAYFNNSDSQINYMNVNNYKIKVELGSGLNSSTSVTDWSTVYGPTPILNSDFSNNNIDITAPDSSRKFQIFIDQQSHSSFSNFFVYDDSFAEYNLQLEIGSSFISGPSNGENSIILEFVAGDSTSLDLYAVEKFEKVSDNLEVTIAKYTSGAGISNTFLQTAVANGFNLPYTSKYTKTVSTPLNSTVPLTSTITTLSDHLDNLKTSITASTFSAWTSASVGSGSPKLTLLPATTTGRAQLVRFLTHGPIVPRSILSLVLEDLTRLEDIYGVPNHRVTYSGSTHSSSLNLKSAFSQSNISSALPTAQHL